MQLNTRTSNNPVKKMGERPKQTFLQRRHTDGQEAHEKVLNIKSKLRCPLPPVVMVISEKPTNYKCWRGCGEKGALLKLKF